MKYDSAEDYLKSQVTARPSTLKEIILSVSKNRVAVIRELNRLILDGRVSVMRAQFGKKTVPFYTMRDDGNAPVADGRGL